MAARKPASLDTTVQEEAEGIDLDAWLSGAKPITDSVRITSKLHLVAEIERLDQEVKDLAEQRDPVERSAADAAPEDPTDAYKALVAEYLESFRTFTFRTRYAGDPEAVRAQMKADGAATSSVEESQIYQTAHYSVSPKLTVAQVRQMIPKIGAPQFERMVSCWFALVNGVPEVKAPK